MQVSKEDDPQHSDLIKSSEIHLKQDRWIYRGAMIAFGVQALVLIGLSIWLFFHFGLTIDYGIFTQAWWLIAHGHLNPQLTVVGIPFWKNHLELLMWPLALLYWLWPNGPTLLIVQDLASIGAEWFGFLILWHVFHRRDSVLGRRERILSIIAVGLLIMNPWVFWANSFDFHFHAIEACLVMATLWAFYTDRRVTGYIVAGLTLFASQVSTTYLVPMGILIFFMNRKRRIDGVIVSALGFGWFFLTEHLGVNGLGFVAGTGAPQTPGTQPSAFIRQTSGVLGIISHPGHILASIWSVRGNVLANFGPTGYLGILSLWGLLVPGLIVVETALAGGPIYTEPGENTIAIWAIATVGTMITLYWLSRKNRWFAGVVAGLVSLSAVGWAVMGYAALPLKYTMVSNQAAHVLTETLHTIPQNAEVIASQGIIGRFADRSHAYIWGFSSTPVVTRSVYFVISPYQGINPMPQQAIFSRMTYLVDTLHVSVLTHTDNVWVYKWVPPPSVHSVVWPGMLNNIPAWTLESSVGHHILTGRGPQWYLAADNTRAGYVMNGDYWRLGMGSYQASVKLQTTGSVNVEVWNDTGNLLLARRAIPATHRMETLDVPFVVAHQFPRNIYSGIGPFQYQPVVPTLDNNIEVRVWTPGHEKVSVYTVGVTTK